MGLRDERVGDSRAVDGRAIVRNRQARPTRSRGPIPLSALVLFPLAVGLVAAACGGLLPTPNLTQPSPVRPEPADDFGSTIDVANGTTLAVTIVVNGVALGVIPASSGGMIKPGLLPPKPWSVEARTTTGRLLLSFAVAPGLVTRTTDAEGVTSMAGAGGRRDLSCGRLDVTVGPPMSGPPPGPGSPGDCVP
jgi:hypothetical protein